MDKIKGTMKSFTWIRNAVLDNPDLNSSDIMTYLSLMRFKNNTTQECYPAILTIMRLARLGQRTVYRCLDKLEQAELIEIKRHRGISNRYSILEPPKEWGEVPQETDPADTPF